MKPPKCRLCEAEHWSYEPHVFPEKGGVTHTENAPHKPESAPHSAPHKSVPKRPEPEVKKPPKKQKRTHSQRTADWKKAHPEEAKLMHRNLMRKKRADAKKRTRAKSLET